MSVMTKTSTTSPTTSSRLERAMVKYTLDLDTRTLNLIVDLYLFLYGSNTSTAIHQFIANPTEYLEQAYKFPSHPFDRWALRFRNLNSKIPLSNITSHPKRSIISKAWGMATKGKKRGILRTMNNYFGVGVDGAISLKFHSARNTMPYFFFSSIINKFWYACVSLSTMLSGRQFDLNQFIDIKCDGKKVNIPSNIQGIIFLNINSYAGGSTLWSPENLTTWQALNSSDGIIEVRDLSFHSFPLILYELCRSPESLGSLIWGK